MEQGLLAERRLLSRQIRRRFGTDTATVAAELLERITSLEAMEPVGEWVIDCADGNSFLGRLRALVATIDGWRVCYVLRDSVQLDSPPRSCV